MVRRLPTRVVTALLALLMMVGGVRSVAARCLAVDGCKKPCCDADDVAGPSIRPVFSCCRLSTAQGVPPQQASTIETAPDCVANWTSVHLRLPVDRTPTGRASATPSPTATAPPLYERHCARLL
jgi:hypothetical protein